MKANMRAEVAKYYDYSPNTPDDISFYINKIPTPQAKILDLGCGTGRVTLALVPHCSYIHGIDLSEAMLSLCKRKLRDAKIPQNKAKVEIGDITDFELNQTFDFIIAPFRVLQIIESDSDIDGLFRCIDRHLAPSGTCILNVFNPNRDRETLRREWCSNEERLAWEVPIKDGRIVCYDRRPRMNKEKLIIYPELIYRKYQGDVLKDEVVFKIAMRCYYPDEFKRLITSHEFDIINLWGGYNGEPYGEGPELVVQFEKNG
ncbi:MAG: class I SAM-dependent DNA methyltransferase [Candidatus Hodarchaeota archaeon]